MQKSFRIWNVRRHLSSPEAALALVLLMLVATVAVAEQPLWRHPGSRCRTWMVRCIR